jgi:hypothetical protein
MFTLSDTNPKMKETEAIAHNVFKMHSALGFNSSILDKVEKDHPKRRCF